MSAHKIIVAIDGFSSCGKSTLAKALAHKLGYNYIDTGAMYRAGTWYALEHDLINDNIEVHFELNAATHHSDVVLNGENVERNIRSMRVSDNVSKVSSIKAVREKM